MKGSRYTLRVELKDGSYLLYSTLTGSLAHIDTETDCLLSRVFANEPLQEEEEQLVRELVEEGLLRDKHADEDQVIQDWYRHFREDHRRLGLIILTTNACNMACPYCFEGQALQGTHMSSDVVEALIPWVARKIDEFHPAALFVRFFGGEPFLNPKGLIRLARGIYEAAMSKGVPMEMAATTNGTLLPKEMVTELVNLGLRTLRVTLDGDEKLHNKKRPLKNGEKSFRKIWNNLEELASLVKFDIAVNARIGDEPGIQRLLSSLSRSSFRASIRNVSVKPIFPFDPKLGTANLRMSCSMGRNTLRWREMTLQAGFEVPSPLQGGPCEIHREAHFVVDPKGDIFPCDTAVSRPSAATGSIFAEAQTPVRGDVREFFGRYTPLEHGKCKNCAYFPLCGGGCRLASFNQDPELSTDIHCPRPACEAHVEAAVRQLYENVS